VSEIVGIDQYAAHLVPRLTSWNEKVWTITGLLGKLFEKYKNLLR
jgi:hypothetical protein